MKCEVASRQVKRPAVAVEQCTTASITRDWQSHPRSRTPHVAGNTTRNSISSHVDMSSMGTTLYSSIPHRTTWAAAHINSPSHHPLHWDKDVDSDSGGDITEKENVDKSRSGGEGTERGVDGAGTELPEIGDER